MVNLETGKRSYASNKIPGGMGELVKVASLCSNVEFKSEGRTGW